MNPIDAAIVAISSSVGESPDDSTALIAAKCRGLMRGYAQRWAASDYVPIEVEKVMMSDLTNPATGRKGKLRVAGKLDVLARRENKTVLIDHKTTSDDVEDPASTYWRTQVVESQWSHYMLLKWQNGEKVDEALLDVIRKPNINPRQLKTKAERASIVANRKYLNQNVSDATLEWLQTNDRENLELYEARLYADTLEKPGYFFQRRTIPRLDAELMEYAEALWDSGQLVLEARRKDRWPKHPASCMNYGRPCTYLGVCSGFSRADGPDWKPRAVVHSELTPEQDKDTLTYSSIRAFQTCPRLFYHRYEQCIERADEERSEALFFGSLIHTALEAYWLALQPEENDNGYSNAAANSVADDCADEAIMPF